MQTTSNFIDAEYILLPPFFYRLGHHKLPERSWIIIPESQIQHHQDFPEWIKICTENILCNFVWLRKAQPWSIITKTNTTPYTVTKSYDDSVTKYM